jgi:hypothetical protein
MIVIRLRFTNIGISPSEGLYLISTDQRLLYQSLKLVESQLGADFYIFYLSNSFCKKKFGANMKKILVQHGLENFNKR